MIVSHKDFTLFLNVLCTPLNCLWWQISKSLLWLHTNDDSKSFIALRISGPDIIQWGSWTLFWVRPTAPTSPLTHLLFCSWAWSIGIDVNEWWVLTPQPQKDEHLWHISDSISLKCTGSHQAFLGWFMEHRASWKEISCTAEHFLLSEISRKWQWQVKMIG